MDAFTIENYLRISLTDVILVMISTILIVLIAKKFFWSKLVAFVEKRQQLVQANIDSSLALKKEAEDLKDQYDKQIKSAGQEANVILENARAQATQEKKQISASCCLMASVYTMRDKISAKKILTRILTPSAIICYNEEKTQFLWERWKTKMRLLVVEDEHSLREDIARKLRLSGYEVDACADGEAALEALAAERYDLVLLDLNLPKVDGMQVLRTLRRHDLETCVLILSARSEIADKVEGLDAGANDYLSKPFHLAELEARVRSLTRRKFIQQDVCLCCGRLSFNTRSRVAAVDGQTLALTRKESGVLEYLLLHQGRPVSQEELIEHVWDGSVDSFSNSIRVHISALRKKLRAALGYDPIRNRIGEGYEIGGEVQ